MLDLDILAGLQVEKNLNGPNPVSWGHKASSASVIVTGIWACSSILSGNDSKALNFLINFFLVSEPKNNGFVSTQMNGTIDKSNRLTYVTQYWTKDTSIWKELFCWKDCKDVLQQHISDQHQRSYPLCKGMLRCLLCPLSPPKEVLAAFFLIALCSLLNKSAPNWYLLSLYLLFSWAPLFFSPCYLCAWDLIPTTWKQVFEWKLMCNISCCIFFSSPIIHKRIRSFQTVFTL